MTDKRCLIINADDFGLSRGVNDGIIEAHERGIVTSASLMVDRPGAPEAADYARRRAELSVGLHVDFGEWRVDASGRWTPVGTTADLCDPQAVRTEFMAQLTRFRALMGRNPTHLDSHQHAHREGEAMMVLRRAGGELGVPVRHFTPAVRYCGDFYGQGPGEERHPEWITASALIELLRSLDAGITELACHPGRDEMLESCYRSERVAEVAALTDERVRRAVSELGITLCSFATAPWRRNQSCGIAGKLRRAWRAAVGATPTT